MTDTQLLNYIRQEMKRQGVVWKKEQELFEMLIANEAWKKYKTSWSNWKHERVHDLKKSPHIRLAIQQTLFFEANIWGASSLVQKEAVQKGVMKAFVEKVDPLPDWQKIIPKFSVSEEQEAFLLSLVSLSIEEIAQKLNAQSEYLKRTFPNQAFLLKLLNCLYALGAYDLLLDKVFPNLLSHQRGDVRVKIMEAHALGSLKEPRFMESVKLLQSIETSDEHKVVDIKTAMLSNLRRYHAQNKNLGYAELVLGMKNMVKMYQDLFLYAKRYHYYPAVNLVYVEQVRTALVHEEKLVDVDEVFQKAKVSIEKERKSKNSNACYYASVTELEFLLLLGRKKVAKKMEQMLATQHPPVALVQRTKRQMQEFVEMVARVGANLPEQVTEFQKVIGLLEDYEIGMKNGK